MTGLAARQLEWQRPLRRGVSIATSVDSTGALGAVVFDRHTGQPLLLSAQHVLGDERGDTRVWQPAPCGDAGCRCNLVGRTLRGRRSIVPCNDQWYYVDAAVAALEPGVAWEREPMRTAPVGRGMSVIKVGPGTGTTWGVLVDDRHVERVRFGFVQIPVPNQLLIRPKQPGRRFASDGDSGALVCDERGRAVGLLWGADGAGRGVACPISPVLDQLMVSFEEQST